MAELLLELFSEEIPARMQRQASDDLMRLVTEGLKAAGIEVKDARAFATPRRLALVIADLPARSPDVNEEKKGPRVGAPDQAIQGFLKGAGLKSIDDAEIVRDEKKGDFYVARTARKGRATGDVIAEIVPDVIRKFPWPKSMRWGSGKLRWVRPLHSIVCLLGGKVVRFEVDGIKSGNTTSGHRFMAPKAFAVKDFKDYVKKLKTAKVILDPAECRQIILDGAKAAAKAKRLELVEDEALLAENAGLTEWPVPLLGSFDDAFLDVPPEVLTTSMKAHQKCFSVRDPKTGGLAANFILVANLVAKDKGKAIIEGNGRVIRARLSDAKFFWDQDRKVKLETRVEKLKDIVFHEKLGTQFERVERIKHLARELAPVVGADPDKAERAALLCKADLVTDMVGEFPELQGLMGKYYARDQEEDAQVADALATHYKPQGPNDAVPADPVSIAVALADKLDTLVGFWAIDEKPTGSKDPYALRRAALGVIRIILENDLELYLADFFWHHTHRISEQLFSYSLAQIGVVDIYGAKRFEGDVQRIQKNINEPSITKVLPTYQNVFSNGVTLLAFVAERLAIQLRDKGIGHDLVRAIFASEGRDQDNLSVLVRSADSLKNFLATEDGANLLAGVKRAQNILRIEERKSGKEYTHSPEAKLLIAPEEQKLASAIREVAKAAEDQLSRGNFEAALMNFSKLRAPVDAFFDKVTVNADDAALRENRLKLLNEIREATRAVADFSKIEG